MEKWEHLRIPLANIKHATNSFRKEIGRGGYGSVYEGELTFKGKVTKIAVKKLNETHGQGLKEFLTEIDLLSGQQHKNIITLVGYCDDENEKIIVYELAEHGSLDLYIPCSNTTNYTLTWLERLKIVVGAACGLDHLHNHLHNNQVIIHRDVKSSNILLDHNWVAKISDLGLSKSTFSGFGRTTVISHACGTSGYVEPEYIRYGFLSRKSDVYSFGMVLFEVLCGRLCTIRDEDGILLLPDVAKEYYDDNKLEMLIDPCLLEQISPNAFSRYSAIAYRCLLDRKDRPFMDDVKEELEKTLKLENGLLRLGKGPLAHQLVPKAKGERLQKSIDVFLPSCSYYPETFSATLSNIIFSTVSSTTKEMNVWFGDDLVYSNIAVQWAERQIELFVRLVKETAPSSETISALHTASICVQASLNDCIALESQGLKLSKVLLVLLQPYIEEVLELNFQRARKLVFDFSANDAILPLSPRLASPLSTYAMVSDGLLVDSGTRFIFMVKDIVDQLTRLVILHFGGNVLTRILELFSQYMDELIKALPEPSEEDSLAELKGAVPFRTETDSEQLALLGTAFTVAEEQLPMVMCKFWSVLKESKEAAGTRINDNIAPLMNKMMDYKDWRRQLQHSLDKLRDHFCRQYVLNFIYSRDGKTRPGAHIYLSGETDDLNWHSDPLPSMPFQALFWKWRQLATVAGDVLLGQEKLQRVFLARLTETVQLWLMSNEEDFWGVLEDQVCKFQPQGLQQLILDMHFTVEIARYAGLPSRNVLQMASSIIARAIRIFSGRGLNQQSVLPEDEWFVEKAKAAIHKLLVVGEDASDTSEIDDDHIDDDDEDDDDHGELHDEVISDSDQSTSSHSTITRSDSFASAESQILGSPSDFTDPDTAHVT